MSSEVVEKVPHQDLWVEGGWTTISKITMPSCDGMDLICTISRGETFQTM